MADYHYSNDPKDTYRTLLSVGDKDNLGIDASSHRNVWTDDGAGSKTDAPFTLTSTVLRMISTRQLQFNDSGTYINSSGTDVLDVVSDGTINIDAATDITLDADGDDIFFKAGSSDSTGLKFTQSGSGDWTVQIGTTDKDLIFKVSDGGISSEVMRLDGDVGALLMKSGKELQLGAADEYLKGDGTDIHFGVGSGGNINIPENIGLTFGDDGEIISGNGTKMTIGGGGVDITATAASTWHTSAGDLTIGGTAQAGAINIKSIEDTADAIVINATTGGIDITADGAAGKDLNLVCTNGSASISSSEDVADAVTILAGAGGIDITAVGEAGQDIDISNTGGSVNISATEAATNAIKLNATAGGIDIDAVDDITIDTTDTSQGIKIGTATSSVPITIGNGTSAVTIADDCTVAGDLTVSGSFSQSVLTVTHATKAVLTLYNQEESNSDDTRDCWLVFDGEIASASAKHQTAYIKAYHGSGANKNGALSFHTNDGTDSDDALTKRLELDESGNARFQGAIGLPAASKLYLDGEDCSGDTYIHESSGDTVKFYIGGADRLVLETTSNISMSNNDSGTENTLFGENAGANLDAGSNYNVFIGHGVSDATMDDATYNVGVGYNALGALTQGDHNVALGASALASNLVGTNNVAIGNYSSENTSGSYNCTVGRDSGQHITTGSSNTYIGTQAGKGDSGTPGTGNLNTAVGKDAGNDIRGTGHENTCLGALAGDSITTGSENTVLGYGADTSSVTAINQTLVGYDCQGIGDNYAVIGDGDTTRVYAADDVGATLYAGSATVETSDARIKEDIKDTSLGLAFVNKLRPVEYKKRQPADYDESLKKEMNWYKNGRNPRVLDELDKNKSRTGFIAQEVGEVIKDIGFDDNNDIVEIDESNTQQMIAYSKLVPPLVKAVQELSAKVEALESAN